MMPRKNADKSRLGPHSRPGKLALIDGRRAEAKLMREVHDELTTHCGGKPSATQRMLIEQVAILTLRLRLLDKAAIEDAIMSERNSRQYLAWANSRSRLLRQLGLESAPEKRPTLADYFATRSTDGVAA